MSKIKVVISYLAFPMTMANWFIRAFQRRDDVELFTVGPFYGNYIPWQFGMTLPDKYVYTPNLPLSQDVHSGVSVKIVEPHLPWTPDLWIQIDSNFHFSDKPKAGVVALIQPDPHVLDYTVPISYSDISFSMQSNYMKPGDIYLPYAFDPILHFPQDLPKENDGCLIGLHYENRNLLVYRLRQRGFKVHYSIGEIYDEYAKIYNQSKVALSWSTLADLPARVWEGMGMGLPVLTNKVPDLSNFFVDGEHYVGFDNVNEAEKKFALLMADDDMREEIGQNAYRKVKEFHTYDQRINSILEYCKLI